MVETIPPFVCFALLAEQKLLVRAAPRHERYDWGGYAARPRIHIQYSTVQYAFECPDMIRQISPPLRNSTSREPTVNVNSKRKQKNKTKDKADRTKGRPFSISIRCSSEGVSTWIFGFVSRTASTERVFFKKNFFSFCKFQRYSACTHPGTRARTVKLR